MEFNHYNFSNGIRLVYKQVENTQIVHSGFILDIGSRDEQADQLGLAHFWEHMAFKGTKKRKAFHILNRLDSVGGELNAYTTKEKICFYASIRDHFFENALELLTDITFDSIFPEKQIEKERSVILEEMSMYHDAPEDAIQDEFDTVVFGNHPLGTNILGTADSVRSFHREDFKKFIADNINTERIIFSVVGNLPFKKVLRIAKKYLEKIPRYNTERERITFRNYQPSQEIKNRTITQALCALGRPAFELNHPYRLPFFMLTNILGGPGMNSRLNLALRERHGFVYSIDASYTPYTDTGLFAIFFGTEPRQLDKSIHLVMKEMKRLREVPLGSMQLHTAKEQLMGQLAMAEENNISLMLMMGRSLLDIGKIESIDDIFARIRKVTSSELQSIAIEMFDESNLSTLKYLPQN